MAYDICCQTFFSQLHWALEQKSSNKLNLRTIWSFERCVYLWFYVREMIQHVRAHRDLLRQVHWLRTKENHVATGRLYNRFIFLDLGLIWDDLVINIVWRLWCVLIISNRYVGVCTLAQWVNSWSIGREFESVPLSLTRCVLGQGT